MVEVRLEGVTKRYAETAALRGVSFTAREGEFFTLVGPSGCGKTTTLRTIAGFEAPDRGTIRFGDRDVAGLPPEDRDVGIVFQNYALFPHLTVAENVGYGLRFRDPPEGVGRRERVEQLLELVDLPGMGDREPDQLSGGQRQRVALARALAPGPELLLLDEPMSALDARLRESLRRTVKSIQSELGITTVYVTHDQEEALAISDRVAVLSDGRIEQVGTPREVYRDPATEFVATFVGENNLFEGTVTDVGAVPADDRGSGTTAAQADDRGSDTGASPADRGSGRADRRGSGTTAGDRAAGTATVDVGPATLRVGTGGRDLSAGDRVTLCVRPEDLSTAATDNRLDATVESWEFLGGSVRVRARWHDRQLVVKLDDVPEGDELSVGFAPGDASLIRVREGEPPA